MLFGIPTVFLYLIAAGLLWHALIFVFIYFKWDDLEKGTPNPEPEARVLTDEEYEEFRNS